VHDRGNPVPVLIHHLRAGPNHHGGVSHGRAFLQNRLAVVRSQSGHAARAEAHAPARGGAGQHQKNNRAHAGNRFLNGSRRSGADFHHGDHRPDPDDDSQRGQHRPHGIAAQRPDGSSKCPITFHPTPPNLAFEPDGASPFVSCRSMTPSTITPS